MPFHFSAAGVFKTVSACWVSPDGSWKRVLGRWVGVDGAWKQYFAAGSVRLAPATIRAFDFHPDIPEVSIEFLPDGRVVASYTNHSIANVEELGDWYDPRAAGAGDGFEIKGFRVTGLPATALSGTVLDAWLSMSVPAKWTLTGEGTTNRTRAITIEVAVRPVGGETVAFAQYTLSTFTYDQAAGGDSGIDRDGGIDRINDYREEL